MLRDFLASCALALPAATTRPPSDYAKLLLQIKRSTGLRAAADRAAALAAAGALPARQRRPFRPLLRGLRALHVAHPPVSGSRRPSRHQGRACPPRVQARRHVVERARRALLAHRAPRATTRRATSRTGSSAISCRTRSAKASTARSAASRASASSSRSTASNIDGLVHVTELGRDYFHFDAGRHAHDRRAQRPDIPARRPHPRHRCARRPRNREDRFHARRECRCSAARRGAKANARPSAAQGIAPRGRPRGTDADRPWTSSLQRSNAHRVRHRGLRLACRRAGYSRARRRSSGLPADAGGTPGRRGRTLRGGWNRLRIRATGPDAASASGSLPWTWIRR